MKQKSELFGLTTIMMILLFGTNCFLYVLFLVIKSNSKPLEEVVKKDKKEKEFSKPFIGTMECYGSLTTELFRTGLIMALTYICEKHWIFDHSTKSYSRDLFLFVLIVFFAYGFYTITPIHDLTLLGREQTEEWKGWMQFIFLLYHYFHAEEVYNSVRVMITCYVWMTGFGNFSFFYIKQDYGWLRVVQMLWRLNFSVLLLMWTHGNTYILYYICPMHTFYFLMVYLTMYTFSSINYSKWGIRVKLIVVALIIYIIWDVNQGLFDFLFGWLGTESVIGAKNGSVWEYYFRTSLDHWSSFLGMIFALNFPLAEQYFVKAKGWPLVFGSILMFGLAVWWLINCYSLEKMEYNLTHSYFAIIPLTAYIYFRNITPSVRSMVSMSLHDLGKTTLETYLLQHHIWLTSNAKTLLTITPGHPWINFALATMLFFIVSKELYRITMSLRGMIIPDDKNIALINCIGLSVTLFLLFLFAVALHSLVATSLEIILTCLTLSIVCVMIIKRVNRSVADHHGFQFWSNRFMMIGGIALSVGVVFQLIVNATYHPHLPTLMTTPTPVVYSGNRSECLQSISVGHWITSPCPDDSNLQTTKTKLTTNLAFCETNKWVWDGSTPGMSTSDCPVSKFNPTKARSTFKGKSIAFLGDSTVRAVYHQFITLLQPDYHDNRSVVLKHSDMVFNPSFDKNMSIAFRWTPMVKNITSIYDSMVGTGKYGLIVMGVSFWDALYIKNIESYKADVLTLSKSIETAKSSQKSLINIWVLPTIVQDNLLPTLDKRTYMNEETIDSYRKAFIALPASSVFSTVIDPKSVSRSKGDETVDGIHYSNDVYDVIAQMIANGYAIHFPPKPAVKVVKKYVPKVTGSMSSPVHGAMIVILSVIMLFLMDSFLGIGFLSLVLFGRSCDWEAAYTPLHNKIFAPVRERVTQATSIEMASQENSDTDFLINKNVNNDHSSAVPSSGSHNSSV